MHINNYLTGILSVLTISILQSCATYTTYFDVKRTPNEQGMQSRVLELPTDTLTMYFFGDYCFEKTKDEFIVASNRTVKKLLKQHCTLKNATQIAFAYTDLPKHYNVFVLYYPQKTLAEVQKEHTGTLHKQQTPSVMYVSEDKDHLIADVFREVEGGILRFASIYKPQNNKSKSAFLNLEIAELFFNRN